MDLKEIENIIGNQFNNWKCLEYTGRNKYSKHLIKCECQCNKKTVRDVQLDYLISNKSKSCGKCNVREIVIGDIFGKLTVVEIIENNKFVKCSCACNSKEIRNVNKKSLLSGTSKSCGCVQKNMLDEYNKKQRKFNEYKIVDGYVIGELSNGEEFYFDIEDLELVKSVNRCWTSNKNLYISISVKRKQIKLHNIIMSPPLGYLVDHIDGNPRNNRRDNLRICTEGNNLKNKKTQSNNTSGQKGVCWIKRLNKWQSRIDINKKRVNLGLFNTFEDAVKARKDAETIYYGEFKNER